MLIFALVLVAAAVATVLFVPVRVELEWEERRRKPHVRVRTQWLFFMWRHARPSVRTFGAAFADAVVRRGRVESCDKHAWLPATN
jgi:hypothetical protein